ncbi:MFS transporter [Mobilicoccus pelagius]|uniref:Putative drug resistance transporter n=1 Tax=Mobilicoccus pelagius NBRC 104925 TaxID=1089455 RepID=H5UMI4_9MICO|nr:MFS transporter [Mobilicoccus pelagius]GAB46942.1 putative drug resistance transporter [Mobilicoccus pelagius NBRC 104925]
MPLRQHLADTRPLQNPYFRRLWTANIVTVVGAQLTIVAVPSQIYTITGSSAYVGLTGVFGLVPLVVFGLYGGALADALDRRRLLVVTTWGLILTTAAFFVQASLGNRNVWLLLALFSVQQAFFAVNQPTRSAVLPKILDVELLPAANSLSMTLFGAGAVVGPLLGGVLIPIIGLSWLYLVDSLTLFATLWAVTSLPPLPVEGTTGRPGLRSVVDGFSYLGGHPVLRMSFVVDLVAMFFGMPRALFPEVAHVSFGGPPGGGLAYAVLFAAMPVGVVLGGVLSGWVSRVRRQGLAVVVAIVVWGAGVTVLGVAVLLADGPSAPLLTLAAVGLAIGGAADMASSAFRQSMLQASASDAVRGRLQGLFIVVVAGGPRLADVAHGAAAPSLGAGWTITLGGVLTMVGVVLAAALAPAFVRYRA